MKSKRLSSIFLCTLLAISGSAFASEVVNHKVHKGKHVTKNAVVKHHAKKPVKKHLANKPVKHHVTKDDYKGERITTNVPVKHHVYAYRGDYKGERIITGTPDHFEMIGAGGAARLIAGNSEMGITSTETDRLVQTNGNSWETLGAQLGVGYIHYFCNATACSENAQWFPSIEPQLNLYYLSSESIKGDVWRFNNPNFKTLTYDIPVHSTRLMLDLAATVVSWRQLSAYVIGGIGGAWTRIGYSDKANGSDSCTLQQLNLSSREGTQFVWEAGLGLTYLLTESVGLSLEYLFIDLGNVKTSSSGGTGTITNPVITPASFNLRSQTALLGLHVAV